MMNITTSNFYLVNTTATPQRINPVNPTVNIVSAVIYSLISVLGVLGNGLVIWVTGFKMKKTVNTVWYLNLAVADFLFTAFLPLHVTFLGLMFHWPFGKFMCKLNTTVSFLNLFVSVYILVVISVDRCVSVMWPVWAQNHRSVRKASCVSLCIWVVAMCITAPTYHTMDTRQVSDIILCTDSHSDYETRSYNHFRNQVIVIIVFLIIFVIPFTVIVSCYALIIHHLRRNRTLASQSSHSFKIITAVIITFFLCWAPAQIMDLIKLEMADRQMQPLGQRMITGFLLADCLVALNSCMNPVLYVFIRQDFKDQVRKSLLNVLESAFQEEDKHSPTEDRTRQIEL